ncbi:MAG: HDOD domain-containing protein, partial [Desulfobacterales bacterium]|nr:HDOD domain-containing protein [Desulfobacterales bacterium]
KKGYILALDDFVFSERFTPLIEIADIIKIDFLLTKGEKRKEVIKQCKNPKVKFLAEKVETSEEYETAIQMGYSYFQGYFFSKPIIISGKDIPSNKLNYLRILKEVNNPNANFNNIEDSVKRDVSLSYKLLKYINSAFFNLPVKVTSIKHAIELLGLKEIKKWVSLAAMGSMSNDKPMELMNISLIRARFCEHIALKIGMQNRSSDFFMMGLLSVVDALIDKPMKEILTDLPIDSDIKDALLGKANKFREVFNLAVAYEKAQWEKAIGFSKMLNIDEANIPHMFFDSVEWVKLNM